ncbi:MAG: 1-deoxy-D-xylulose-5-phosphate reductoisomerase [Kiritimatiellae bacterium]|nr:1-deoxy-D-xylulose-5-phosphate reductoisomerase [Kiritimatiellia bacterium]
MKTSRTQSAPPRKKIVLLGSTGSIGENVLRVAERFPGRFQIVGLAAQHRAERLFQQAQKFNVKQLGISDPGTAQRHTARAPAGAALWCGAESLEKLAALPEADVVVAAVVGMAGLKPVLTALRAGKNVALATKEVLVAAGAHVLQARAQSGAAILPVDSEHSAIFQCLQGHPAPHVRRIILTASGGPFANRPAVDFEKVSVADVLKHPRWNMGKKVTVDSATMMNKGLEIMEAHWLFNIALDRIEVLIHPESIVHSLVEFVDGAMLAQLSAADMRFAIQYALTYPDRLDGRLPKLNLAEPGSFHFALPDEKRFPCLALARRAASEGGTMPAVLNAANEVAVRDFLQGRIKFSGIWRIVETVMGKHRNNKNPSLDEIILADQWAREQAKRLMDA